MGAFVSPTRADEHTSTHLQLSPAPHPAIPVLMKAGRLAAVLAVTAAFLAGVVSTGKDFYGILGVPKTARDDVIKRAYRKLSLKFHPDKAQGDKQQAEKKFVEISQAYEVLSDPK